MWKWEKCHPNKLQVKSIWIYNQQRSKPEVNITEDLAGEKEGAATAVHLIALKELVNQIMKHNKTAYIIFFDVRIPFFNEK